MSHKSLKSSSDNRGEAEMPKRQPSAVICRKIHSQFPTHYMYGKDESNISIRKQNVAENCFQPEK